ncbi:MAG: ATP-dependent RNA helicase HrpA, partial [Acidimicrobiales bacterium]
RKWLTPIGRDLAKLPVDPRYGRMLIDAADNNCLDEVMIIVAGLSIQDPRERPREKQQQAAEAHRRFADDGSDFLGYLNLWDHVLRERKDRSRNQFRRMCRREFLNYNRVIEWQDIHSQLRRVAGELGLRPKKDRGRTSNDRRRRDHENDQALRDDVHRSLLVGLLSHIGLKDQRSAKTGNTANDARGAQRAGRKRPDYLGARSTRFTIAPGSAMTKGSPNWLMAAELVETTRLWARVVAPIDVEWIEDLAEHLATYAYGDPWWDRERGTAMVHERVSLYGLTLAANRIVQLGPIDPALARDLFIHHALIDGEWDSNHTFATNNREVFAALEALETKSRRRDLVVESKAIHRFFDERLPDHIISTVHFDSWWGKERREHPNLLDLRIDDVTDPDAGHVDPTLFPDSWLQGDLDLELVYELDAESHLDGVSVLVPVEVLNQVDPAPFEWSVPGYRRELIGELIRSMPKATRRLFVPVAETIAAVESEISPADGRLREVLAKTLGHRAGAVITVDDFDTAKLSRHLRPTFRIINADYELLAEGKDLHLLRAALDAEVRTTLTTAAKRGTEWDRSGITTWDFGTLPSVVTVDNVKGYPALVDEGDSVAIRLEATADERFETSWDGARRLLRFRIAKPAKRLDQLLDDRTKLQLVNGHVQARSEWYNDAIAAVLDIPIRNAGGPPWTETDFEDLVVDARSRFDDDLETIAGYLVTIVESLGTIHARIDQLTSPNFAVSVADVRDHVARLAYPGFLAGIGADRLGDVSRYLQGIGLRLDGIAKNPTRDTEAIAICRRLDNELATIQRTRPPSAEMDDVVWMLEELRISLFAQGLGAKGKISEQRVRRALAKLREPG